MDIQIDMTSPLQPRSPASGRKKDTVTKPTPYKPRPFKAPDPSLAGERKWLGDFAEQGVDLLQIPTNLTAEEEWERSYHPGAVAAGEWVVRLVPSKQGFFKGASYDLQTIEPMELVELSRACDPNDLPADANDRLIARVSSYLDPSREVLEKVTAFVRRRGLLSYLPGRLSGENFGGCGCDPWYFLQCDTSEKPKDWSDGDEPLRGKSRYGELEHHMARFGRTAESPPLAEFYNPVAWLLNEAFTFRQAYELWQALSDFRRTRDAGPAAKLVRDLYPRSFRDVLERLDKVQSRQRHAYWIDRGYMHLSGALNMHLELCHLSTRFVWPEEIGGVGRQRIAAPAWDLVPLNLLGAYWSRLFLDVQAGRPRTICRECGEPFDSDGRADRVFCKESHATRYRVRRHRGEGDDLDETVSEEGLVGLGCGD